MNPATMCAHCAPLDNKYTILPRALTNSQRSTKNFSSKISFHLNLIKKSNQLKKILVTESVGGGGGVTFAGALST